MSLSDLPTADIVDPVSSAAAPGCVTSRTGPGIRRRRAGRGWAYRQPDGSPVRDAPLRRIKPLAIPPAWTDVWICPDPRGHLQATGRDARGRKQYRYHPRWREVRDAVKFDRMVAFAEALPPSGSASTPTLPVGLSASWCWPRSSVSCRTP